MNIRESAQETADALFKLLSVQPSSEHSGIAVKLVEQAIIEAYRESAKHCTKVASQSLGPVAFQLGGACPFRLRGRRALGPFGPLLKRQRPPGPARIRLADRREATAAQFPAIRPPEGS